MQDFHITFGCPPHSEVNLDSRLVKGYTQCILEHLNKTGGVLCDITTALQDLKPKYLPESVQ